MIIEFSYKSLQWKTITDNAKILETKDAFILDCKFPEDPKGKEMVNICEYFAVQNYFEMEPDYGYIEICILNLLKEANKAVCRGHSLKFMIELIFRAAAINLIGKFPELLKKSLVIIVEVEAKTERKLLKHNSFLCVSLYYYFLY